ncbi:hypothetical protein HBP99_04905 [Listeria booriae]|uniref:hypothetical protein n=1 Tax=Listeria booriae TaxID=1552123 RepID=UPI00162AB1B9|nr:hypothetical protein [Listeria booriae]MBC2367962.1 hypothetical protein [Listeria booriae]
MDLGKMTILNHSMGWEMGTISAASGNLVSATNRMRSEMLLLEPGTVIDMLNFEKFQMTILIYDTEKKYIATTGWIRKRYYVESVKNYAIVLANVENSSLVGLVDEIATQVKILLPDKSELSICTSRLDSQKKLDFITNASNNFFNKYNIVQGLLWISSDGSRLGTIEKSEIYITSLDFIDVKEGETWISSSNASVIFYDENYVPVNGLVNASGTVVVPLRCRYIRISVPANEVTRYTFFRAEEEKHAYLPFRYELRNIDIPNKYVTEKLEWMSGTILAVNGMESASESRVRSRFWYLKAGTVISIENDEFNQLTVMEYDSNLLFCKSSGWCVAFVIKTNNYYRIVLSKKNAMKLISDEKEKLVNALRIIEKNDLADYASKIGTGKLNRNGALFHFQVNFLSGNYGSSHCFVEDELWCFSASNDDHTNWADVQRFKIDFINDMAYPVGHFFHNFGHMNSAEYSAYSQSLIFGNGSGSYTLEPKIHIISNVSQYKNQEYVDISEVALTIDCGEYNWGKKLNVVWGDGNLGRGDIAFLILDDNKKIMKIQLGKGNNDLGMGQFKNGKADIVFNGSFRIIQEWSQKNGDEVNQDSCYYNGHLYLALGHDGLWYSKNELTKDSTIAKTYFYESFYNANGKEVLSTMEGITVTEKYVLLGCSRGKHYIHVYSR